ncbi:eukaryotic initiation factor [Piptocephalis cylindrospora]|uniref:Translation initiation factor eIF2B subunit alpha n=1 Tax=Piptocephalis cylindrospora TaxID=1907219 RepID=A0A4P9Y5Q9_9FUNG|nr:eukaryotic initiation factor [Piptocephalis cylindrospora]|eukprot:RKP13140.1 eukaryotic initiation factor [Piptocephalis cylindrospora]
MPTQQGDTTYEETVTHFRDLVSTRSLPFPVAAFASLLEHARRSQALTISELTHSLSEASTHLRLAVSGSWPLEAGCMLFKRFFATVTANSVDLEMGRRDLLRRGDQYVATACTARETIAGLAANFIKDDTTILLHSYSRVILALLEEALRKGKRFSVLVAEASPTCSGKETAKVLKSMGVTVRLIPDAAVAALIHMVDAVWLGAEAVAENGGLVSQVGTRQLAVVAKEASKPLFAAVESYKFVRKLPLGQADLPVDAPTALQAQGESPGNEASKDTQPDGEEDIEWIKPAIDFTPPELVTLLVTDLGVMAPSAVGDELFRIYG